MPDHGARCRRLVGRKLLLHSRHDGRRSERQRKSSGGSMKSGYTREKILIWAKTYPELSSRYLETVCTAGLLPSGKPLRLYPIPYRYLGDGKEQFRLYQWITADIQKRPDDSRPESFRIDCDSIEPGEVIPTTQDEWGKRAAR
jgi:hypothetical protein